MDNSSLYKRKHKRYMVTDDAIAVIKKKVGRITDISEGGMAVNYINDEPFSEEDKATILNRTKSLLINGLPIRLVRENDKPFLPMSGLQIQTVGVKFYNTNANQQEQIKRYVSMLS